MNKKELDLNNNELISIIVPIYNVEQYLKRCIDSIINQTYKNLEIILVDDGATDNSGKICDEYALKDSRIRVIHKRNGGLSSARNIGLIESFGKLVTFVDSDDCIASELIDLLYSSYKQTSSDIVSTKLISNYSVEDNIPIKIIGKPVFNVEYSKDKIIKELMYRKILSNSVCGKLFNKALFDDCRFPEGCLYEDLAIVYKLVLKSNSVCLAGFKGYYYLQRKNSILHSNYSEKDLDLIIFSENMIKDILAIYPNCKFACKVRFVDANIQVIRKLITSVNKDGNKYIFKVLQDNIIKNCLYVLMNLNTSFRLKILTLISIIGRQFLMFLEMVLFIKKLVNYKQN